MVVPPMSVTYSTKTRLSAARAVMEAKTHEAQKEALRHSGVFNVASTTGWLAHEGEAEYVERLFAALYMEVISWYLLYLEERIEALESPGAIDQERERR